MIMKDSGIDWIGKIPANWAKGKLKHVYEIYTGDSIKDEDKDLYTSPDNAIPYISTKDIDVETKCINYENGLYIPVANNKFKIAPKDSFLLCVEGGSAGKKIAYTTTDVCFVNKLCCFRAKQQSNSKFMYFYCQCDAFLIDFDLNMTGLIGGVSQNTIKNIDILIPPESEQKIIAYHLDKECARIDSLVEKQRSIIEKLKEYKKSVITETVTRGLNPTAPMKDSGIEWIGKIPAHWKTCKLQTVSDIFGRIGFRGYTQNDLVDEGEGAITLSPSNILDCYTTYAKCSYLSWDKYNESPEIQIKNNDVIFVKTGSSYGKSGLVINLPIEATINPQLIVFKNITINPKLFLYILNSSTIDYQTQITVVGGTIPTMSQEKIKKFIFVLPDTKEQIDILTYLDQRCGAIDSIIEKREQMIKLLLEYKRAFIYESVTGKKDFQ